MVDAVRSVRIIGPGRAGGSLAAALANAGWTLVPPLGRGDDLAAAAEGVDVLVIATPDSEVERVAREVEPAESTTVIHLAGSLGLGALEPHPIRAAVHPLVSLPDTATGARRLGSGIWFAVAASGERAAQIAGDLVRALNGRSFSVPDELRPLYHATASVASNHFVALMGQVARLADLAGVPLAAYLELVRSTFENVAALGPEAALTGPVARGDWETVRAHQRALPAEELPAYDCMAAEAARLCGRHLPPPDHLT
ncbi:MAG TPA: DUF2520 domain-containing protein [Acidimicrobiales bacterium]|nr:DUF2520 domain-containing protein [Acidimicrobiales bacterium]